MTDPFIWWYVRDGVAIPVEDCPAVSDAINSGNMHPVFGSIEGAIINGGVQATAFKRTVEKTYDAPHYFKTGEMLPVGEVTITKITAEPRGHYD
jgi:hypothetical protein